MEFLICKLYYERIKEEKRGGKIKNLVIWLPFILLIIGVVLFLIGVIKNNNNFIYTSIILAVLFLLGIFYSISKDERKPAKNELESYKKNLKILETILIQYNVDNLDKIGKLITFYENELNTSKQKVNNQKKLISILITYITGIGGFIVKNKSTSIIWMCVILITFLISVALCILIDIELEKLDTTNYKYTNMIKKLNEIILTKYM